VTIHTGKRLGATYRLQLNGLGFSGARHLVPYLHDLGVETVYLSPVTRATTGSTHGYDVVDPTCFDPALGSGEDYEDLLRAVATHDMTVLLDIVPNHMAASLENPYFKDTLRLGPESPYGALFDIDWAADGGRVLLPVLRRPLGEVIEAGELTIVTRGNRLELDYGGLRFPLAPGSARQRRRFADPDLMFKLLERQHYRLAYWAIAPSELNYRRFFDINGLIGVRLEEEDNYELTHRFVLSLAADPRVAGLRVDHVDGLFDPATYLERLAHGLERSRGANVLLVEKILAEDESLPAEWPVDGTTGYEFAALAGGLLVDSAGAATFTEELAQRTGDHRPFTLRAQQAKRAVTTDLFPGQLRRLTENFLAVTSGDLGATDLTESDMTTALVEYIAALDVYRTYVVAGEPPSAADSRRIASTEARALEHCHDGSERALHAIARHLAATEKGDLATGRLQQLSGAVAAKGVEDTALYNPGTLLSAAEVGGHPEQPATTPKEFHQAMERRLRDMPGAQNAGSTHDTKRSEDVRARLAVLSEAPERFFSRLDRWRSWHAGLRAGSGGAAAPDPTDECYLYQTLFATWPENPDRRYRERITAHMEKAGREQKRDTSWLDPDLAYEKAVARYVTGVLATRNSRFRKDMTSFVNEVAEVGYANSLALVVLRICAPGVPDTYQGDELYSFELVDPDNRRPVDYTQRRQLLGALREEQSLAGTRASLGEPGVKLAVTRAALLARRAHPDLFAFGGYTPLKVTGPHADHVVAFSRTNDGQVAIAAVQRLGLTLRAERPPGPLAGAITLGGGAPDRLVDVLTGREVGAPNGEVALDPLFSPLPVAILIGQGS
jgi:(1->4)-alpha-D-glucan 1-alpha-D-glucosylmutase